MFMKPDVGIESTRVGIIGCGHLGRAIAFRLLEAGLPRASLALSHAGSSQTHAALVDEGFEDLVLDSRELAGRAQLVLYLVRPQDRAVIAGLEFGPDTLVVSFLAGVPVNTLAVHPSRTRRVRMMTSTPDTIRAADAIAAVHPSDDERVIGMCRMLGARVFRLSSESDFSAFTALGPCLPVALTVCEGMGREVDASQIAELASDLGLEGWDEVVQWARARQPLGLTRAQRDTYIAQASTPGGVTEAVVSALRAGMPLTDSLLCGVVRSDEMAES